MSWRSDAKLAVLIVVSFFLVETLIARGGQTSDGDEKGSVGPRPSHEPLYVQEARASQPHRGRRAASPFHIPYKGWKDIAWRWYAQIGDNRLLAVAAGVVFYMLLALVPAIAAVVSTYGIFADARVLSDHLAYLEGIMPASGISILQDQIQRLMATSNSTLGFGVLINFALSLWSANAGMKAIIDALNVAYDEHEKRSFLRLSLEAFAFTLGGLVFLMITVAAIVAVPLVYSRFGITSLPTSLSLLRWPLMLVVIVLWLALLYRFGPSRTQARWEWLTIGSILAAVAWLSVSFAFSWYLAAFANYDATYGSLGAIVGLMMWLWLSVIVMLLGAQLNAEIEHQTAVDTTVPPDKPLGGRGAVMADTVGETWHSVRSRM